MASLQADAGPVEEVTKQAEEAFSPVQDTVTESKIVEPDMELEEPEEVVVPEDKEKEEKPAEDEQPGEASPTTYETAPATTVEAATGATNEFGEVEEEEDDDDDDEDA